MVKTILLGIHDQPRLSNQISDTVAEFIRAVSDWEVTIAKTEDGMLDALGLNAESTARNHYDAILMDANLGNPKSDDYDPAKRMYEHVRVAVESGETKFMSTTGHTHITERIQREEDFDCVDKTKVWDFIDTII
tara:strand:- start:1025 stop:1426 length:402 start_codon:yes stop_codon:yes gene_type:complete